MWADMRGWKQGWQKLFMNEHNMILTRVRQLNKKLGAFGTNVMVPKALQIQPAEKHRSAYAKKAVK